LATQFFSDEQMERLRSYPDIGREELIRFFTLTRKDLGFVDNLERGGGRGPAARLGLAVQLCTLPWLGFVPDDLWSVPQAAVLRLANQLAVFPGVLEQYGRRAQTRSDHLKLVLKYLDWKTVPTGGEPLKELEQFLQNRAMEHDTPSLLFHQAAEFLVSAHVTRPGVVTLMEMVATARTGAGALTSEKVGHLLTGQVRGDLDRLLIHDAGLGMTWLTWLTTPAVEATSAAVKTAIEKLLFLRGMDAHHLDLSMLPRERRRFLATLGRRSTEQGLERRGERRYPILLALVAQSASDQLDEVIALFDQAVSARESRAKARTDEALAERAKKGEARQLLMDVILPVLIDVGVPDENVGGMLRTRIGMDKLREVAAVNWKPLPRDHGRLAALEASYSYLRQFTPHVLNAIDFQGGPGTGDLMDAVEILKDLNRVGGRKVPAGAPVSFVPARYAGYLAKASKSGDETTGSRFSSRRWSATWPVTARWPRTCSSPACSTRTGRRSWRPPSPARSTRPSPAPTRSSAGRCPPSGCGASARPRLPRSTSPSCRCSAPRAPRSSPAAARTSTSGSGTSTTSTSWAPTTRCRSWIPPASRPPWPASSPGTRSERGADHHASAEFAR
jgi:hypothetical protein